MKDTKAESSLDLISDSAKKRKSPPDLLENKKVRQAVRLASNQTELTSAESVALSSKKIKINSDSKTLPFAPSLSESWTEFLERNSKNPDFVFRWDASPEDEDHLEHGLTLIGYFINTANQNHKHLDLFLKSPLETFENLPWNMVLTNSDSFLHGVSLAWLMFTFAQSYLPLVEKLKTLPESILAKIKLNQLPLNKNFVGYNASLPLVLAVGHPSALELLDRFLSLDQKSFIDLDWNAGFLYSKSTLKGRTLAGQAIILADRNRPDLLEKLLSLPAAILQGIYWNDPISNNAQQADETLLFRMLDLFLNSKLHLRHIAIFFNHEVIASFHWDNNRVKEKLYLLLNRGFFECDMALAILPNEQINRLIECFADKPQNELNHYLDFLKKIQFDGSIPSVGDIKLNPLKASTAYFAIARESKSVDERIVYFTFKK